MESIQDAILFVERKLRPLSPDSYNQQFIEVHSQQPPRWETLVGSNDEINGFNETFQTGQVEEIDTDYESEGRVLSNVLTDKSPTTSGGNESPYPLSQSKDIARLQETITTTEPHHIQKNNNNKDVTHLDNNRILMVQITQVEKSDFMADYADSSDVKVTERLAFKRAPGHKRYLNLHQIEEENDEKSIIKKRKLDTDDLSKIDNLNSGIERKSSTKAAKELSLIINLSDGLEQHPPQDFQIDDFNDDLFKQTSTALFENKSLSSMIKNSVKLHYMSLQWLKNLDDPIKIGFTSGAKLSRILCKYVQLVIKLVNKKYEQNEVKQAQLGDLKIKLISQSLSAIILLSKTFESVLLKLLKDVIVRYLDVSGIVESHLNTNPKSAYIQRYISGTSHILENWKLKKTEFPFKGFNLLSENLNERVSLENFKFSLNILFGTTQTGLVATVSNDYTLKIATRILLMKKD